MANHKSKALLNLLSYNSKGFKNRNFNFIQHVLDGYSFICMQEHWLYDFQFKDFHKILPNYSYYALSSMCSNELSKGRGYGGTAILWRKDLFGSITPIKSNSPRVCIVEFQTNVQFYIIMSIYMPTDELKHDNEFFDVLYEIKSIFCQYSNHEFIVAGDFNCDVARPGARSRGLRAWAEECGLHCPALTAAHPRQCTFTAHDGTRSLLDYIFVSSDIHTSNYNVISDGTNLSDHDPVTISSSISINQVDPPPRGSCNKGRRPEWHKASDENIEFYKNILNDKLNQIQVPWDALRCTEWASCNKHFSIFNNFFEAIVEACNSACVEVIPHSPPGRLQNKVIPGWNNTVKEKYKTSKFWHEMWVMNNRPCTGWVAQIRRKTRAEYHRAVKVLKGNKEKELKIKVSNELSNNNSKGFWQIINKMNKTNSENNVVIEKKCGTEACEVFKTKYEALYNQYTRNEAFDDISRTTKDGIKDSCCINNKGNHYHNVTVEEVKKVMQSLKRGQYDSNIQQYSDSIINGCDKLFVFLSFLYSIMISHGYCNHFLNDVTIRPLLKDVRKSKSDVNNYRAIAPNGIYAKILDYLILNKFPNIFESSNQQFAYKKKYSTTMCTFLVLETIQYYRNNGSNLIVTLLDMTKAFDLVKFDKLFTMLKDLNLCPLISRLLVNLYMSTRYYVLWNDHISVGFNITNGVKQGGVLSPKLFTIYCNPLIDRINKLGKGCRIGGRSVAIFVYADDIILLSPTRGGMQQLLDTCYQFVQEVGLKFNMGKCKAILFGSFINILPLNINGIDLKYVDSEEHLGHVIGNFGTYIDLNSCINDMTCKANGIVRELSYLCTESKRTIFTANCMSLYGAQLIDLNSNQMDSLNVNWRKTVRYVMNVSNRTRSVLIPSIINTPSVEVQVKCRMVNFLKNGLSHESAYINFLFTNSVLGYHSYFSRNVNTICHTHNLNIDFFMNNSSGVIIKKIKSSSRYNDWRCNMIRELLLCRDGKMTCDLIDSEVEEILHYVCSA